MPSSWARTPTLPPLATVLKRAGLIAPGKTLTVAAAEPGPPWPESRCRRVQHRCPALRRSLRPQADASRMVENAVANHREEILSSAGHAFVKNCPGLVGIHPAANKAGQAGQKPRHAACLAGSVSTSAEDSRLCRDSINTASAPDDRSVTFAAPPETNASKRCHCGTSSSASPFRRRLHWCRPCNRESSGNRPARG